MLSNSPTRILARSLVGIMIVSQVDIESKPRTDHIRYFRTRRFAWGIFTLVNFFREFQILHLKSKDPADLSINNKFFFITSLGRLSRSSA